MREDCFFSAGEAQVAGQGKLTSDARRAPADRRNRHNRRTAQAHEHVGQRLQASWSWWEPGRVLEFGNEIVVREEKPFHGAVKNDNFDLFVGFKRCNNLVQLWNGVRTKNVQWRMINGDAPIVWGRPRKTNLLSVGCRSVECLRHRSLLAWSISGSGCRRSSLSSPSDLHLSDLMIGAV